jgi:hypothetical protein
MRRSRYLLAAFAALAFCARPQEQPQAQQATQGIPARRADGLRQLTQAIDAIGPFAASLPYEDGGWQERDERQELLYLIDEALADREADIDRIADEMAVAYNCEHEEGKPVDKQMMRALLSGEAAHLVAARDTSAGRGSDYLHGQLSHILEDSLTFEARRPSLVRTMARARYYEKCLGEEGAFDMYLDYHDAMSRGDCGDAEGVALSIGDRRHWLEVSRYCVQPEMRSEHYLDIQERGKSAFYATLDGASDEDLAISAGMVYSDEYARWLPVCEAARGGRGMSDDTAAAYCLADLIAARDGQEGGFPTPDMLGLTTDQLREMIDSLPHGERRCALQASLDQQAWYEQDADEPDESLWPPDRYRKCFEE